MSNDHLDETNPSRPEPEDNPENTHPSAIPGLEESLSATQPSIMLRVDEETPSDSEAPGRRAGWLRRVFVGLLIFAVIVALGALGGYQSGINARVDQQDMQAATEAAFQFEQGLADLQAGNFEQARQRFEYVIRIDPSYPGAVDQLAQALLALNSTNTPTPVPTSTATPIPVQDTSDLDGLYAQAQQLRTDQDWDTLLATLDALRGKDPTYYTVEVDGLYYEGLRNRGVDRILVQGNLEGGIFDLNLAEQFAPIDTQADGYRQWAEWYLTGASFWEVDWGQAVTYFSFVAQVAPNLSDSSYFTAQSRLATAQYNYADTLMVQVDYLLSNKQWCDANDLALLAQSYKALEPEIQSTADFARAKCDIELGTERP